MLAALIIAEAQRLMDGRFFGLRSIVTGNRTEAVERGSEFECLSRCVNAMLIRRARWGLYAY